MTRGIAHCWLTGLLPAPLVAAQLPPVRIILVGDATVAINDAWGPGFCADMVPQVTCIHRAKRHGARCRLQQDAILLL